MDIYSIGELLIDFIPGSEPNSYVRNAGGAPANVCCAVAKNGLSAGMLTCVGDDDFGHFLYDTLKENSVTVLNPEYYKDAITTMAFVTLDESGDRSFTFARKPGADMFLSEDKVKKEDIEKSVIIHAGSCSLSASHEAKATIKALKLGHELRKIVSFDLNYRNVMWDNDEKQCAEAVFSVLPYIDFLKISEEEAPMIGGENNLLKLMKEFNITLIMETLGANGARCYYNGEIFEIDGRKANCVDTTGAGDAFWGGFLSYLRFRNVAKPSDLSVDILTSAMNYGNISGWICVQSKGGIPSLPTKKEIEQYL